MCPALAADLDQEVITDPYDSFMRHHLQHYGYFRGPKDAGEDFLGPPRWSGRNQGYLLLPPESDSDKEENKKLIYSLLLETSLFKSRQVVFDHLEGRVVPRLREPRGLFATPTPGAPLQAARWPLECEVIKEKIHHIEWSPQSPERFYELTGKETKPQIVGEESGTVVYQINPANKGSYFTCSRVGGSRGPITSAGVSKGQDGHCLQFESRFESGNLQRAVKVGSHEYELTLRHDLYTSKHTQWFYFQVKNTRKGALYRFTITNLMKSSSLYSLGMKPLLYSQTDAQTRSVGWRREGSDIKYYKNPAASEGPSLYCLTWTCQFPYDGDTCYFAHCYPYTYSDLQGHLQSVANDPVQSQYCKLRALCRSLAGNTVYLLTITSPTQHSKAAAAKRAVVVTARVHPGETNGSWMMKGFLDFILSDAPDAHLLRDLFIFKVVPMLNPDGVIVGNYRCSLTGRDLNRNYRTMLKDSFPCIWHTRSMVKRLLSEHEILLYCDFHGHSRKNNVFMYGCNNKHHPTQQLHERVFPLMLSKNAPQQFSFQGCKFKVQKSKEGTGRIVMWKMGIQNSYTMESTFGGSTLGSKKGTHFTSQDLKSMGHYFCDTLLDYCDPDSSKFVSCLAELKEILHQEICQKMVRLGQDVSNQSLSDISLSDIESSTSGSNSSESDGLPAHLLIIAEKFKQKKKRLRSRKERNKLLRKWNFNRKANQQQNILESTSHLQRPKLLLSQSFRKGDGSEQRNLKAPHEKDSGNTISSVQQHGSPSSRTVEEGRGGNKMKQAKCLETVSASCVHLGLSSTTHEVPHELRNTEAPPEKPRLTYVTGQSLFYHESNMSQENEVPFGDTLSHRHIPPRSQHQQAGARHPLVITVIQQPRRPVSPRERASPIKQHPPPFDPLLSQQGDGRQDVFNHVYRRDAPVTRPQPSSSHDALLKPPGSPLSWTHCASPGPTAGSKPLDTRRTSQETMASFISSGSEYFTGFLQKKTKESTDPQGLIPSASTLSSQRLTTTSWTPSTPVVFPKVKSKSLVVEEPFLAVHVSSSLSLVPQISLKKENAEQREKLQNPATQKQVTQKSGIPVVLKGLKGRSYPRPSAESATGKHTSDLENASKNGPRENYAKGSVPQKSERKAVPSLETSGGGPEALGMRNSLLQTLTHQLSTLGEDSESDQQEGNL